MNLKTTIIKRIRIFISRKKTKRDSAVIASSARLITTVIAALLFLPIAMISVQSNSNLESFHNRLLRHWPEAQLFVKSPVDYFAAAKDWINDRVFPIVEVSLTSKRLLLELLNVPPEKRVTMGRNDHIILNGASDKDLYRLFEDVCFYPHDPASLEMITKALHSLSDYSRSRNIEVDVILVPTAPTLYGNYLPDSVPEKYRVACGESAKGNSLLVATARQSDGALTYPLLEMIAARDDEAFFPKANYHPRGLSIKVVRDTYLQQQKLSPPSGEKLELTSGPSEILSAYRISRNVPVYQLHNDALHEMLDEIEALDNLAGDLSNAPQRHGETNAYESVDAPNKETVLMLSDSFGAKSSSVFAGAFSKLLQRNVMAMAASNAPIFVDRVRKSQKLNRVILLLNEGNLGVLLEWGKAFGSVQAAGG